MSIVRQRVIPVRSSFVNSFIIQGQKAILVDTGTPGYEKRILHRMEEKGVKKSDISLIIITHGHYDHFGSAFILRENIGAPVAIHRADVESLKTGINPPLISIGIKGRIMAGLTKLMKPPRVKGFDADILIEDEMDLSPYGVNGKIINTPGHTEGSVSVFMDGGCMLVGDLICGGLLRAKAPGYPYFGYDRSIICQSVKKVLDYNPKIIYAGHGGPFTVEDVRRRFMS